MRQEAAVTRPVLSAAVQEKLAHYRHLLEKWTQKINLVAPNTLRDASTRHFKDSLQLLQFVTPEMSRWCDLGSGGGFPGLPLAIAAQEIHPGLHVELIESDARKAAFLRTVSRETSTPVTVHAARIEDLAPRGADAVSARALAPLPRLLPLVARHLAPHGVALLMKGAGYRSELADARAAWDFSCVDVPSVTSPGSVVLRMGELRHV